MTGTIPSLNFDELPELISDRLRSKYERLGYLGEFFAKTAHQEKALAAFIDFTEASKSALEMPLVELIALTIAHSMDVPYERNQHELLSVKLGFTKDWVRAVELLNPSHPDASPLSEQQCSVQRYIIDALETNGHGATDSLNEVVIAIGHEAAVAVMMVMARYVGHALMVSSMDIESPVASIFEDTIFEKQTFPEDDRLNKMADQPNEAT